MKDVSVSTGLASNDGSQFGTHGPQNSGETLKTNGAPKNEVTIFNREIPLKEHDRVESDRVPSNRVVD